MTPVAHRSLIVGLSLNSIGPIADHRFYGFAVYDARLLKMFDQGTSIK
jgi:hypothetical protein